MSNKIRNMTKKNEKKENQNAELEVSSNTIREILMNMMQLMIVSETNAQLLVAKGICTEEEYKEHLKIAATKFSLIAPENDTPENAAEMVDNITDINEINEMLLNRKKEESNTLEDLFIKKDENNDGE